jgi:hypothetical protein
VLLFRSIDRPRHTRDRQSKAVAIPAYAATDAPLNRPNNLAEKLGSGPGRVKKRCYSFDKRNGTGGGGPTASNPVDFQKIAEFTNILITEFILEITARPVNYLTCHDRISTAVNVYNT